MLSREGLFSLTAGWKWPFRLGETRIQSTCEGLELVEREPHQGRSPGDAVQDLAAALAAEEPPAPLSV